MTGLAVLQRRTTTPDGVLVQEAAAGSGVSYGALYDRYATQVFNYCLRLTGSQEDASDATQEAFVNVLRRLQDDDRPVLEFSSYLFAAARHESYALMRQRTRTHLSDSPPPERGRVADLDTDPERSALLRDSQEAVRVANAKLAPRHREVLALREVAGRSYEEIGVTMGLSENAAAQLIFRARGKLREALSAGAVASVVATSEECERAQLLLSMVQDGEAVDEVDRDWLDQHLDECGSCKTANRLLLEIGASYRCWMPVALLAGMRTDTLTRAGELVGADWSHVPTPGKSAAASTGAAAGGVAAVAAAVVAATAIGGLTLMRDDNPAAPVDPVAERPAASAQQSAAKSTPARKRDAKPAPDVKLVAARTAGSLPAPALSGSPFGAPGALNESALPGSGNTPPGDNAPGGNAPGGNGPGGNSPGGNPPGGNSPGNNAPGGNPPPNGGGPGQPPGDSPGGNSPAAPGPTTEAPVVPGPIGDTPTPPGSDPTRPVPPADPPDDSTDPPDDPTVPPTLPTDPACSFPGRGNGPDECPPGHVDDPPDGGRPSLIRRLVSRLVRP